MSALVQDPRRRLLLAAGGGLVLSAFLPWPAKADEAVEISLAGTANGSSVWFRPRGLLIRPGQAVRWVNHDTGNVHTATAYHPANGKPLRLPQAAKPWDSGYLLPEQSFTWVFETPGVYDYFCLPHEHAGMVGRIVVAGEEAPADHPYAGTDAQVPQVAVAGFPAVTAILSQGKVD